MTMKKVQPGDPLQISAATYNAFIDVARDHQARLMDRRRESSAASPQAGLVLVRNESGADQPRLAILGIDGPIIDPQENADQFKNQVALIGVTPDVALHTGRFVVLADPLASGRIGRAYASGVCAVRLVVSDSSFAWQYAEIADGVTAHLKTSLTGSATILWHESSIGGSDLAIVRLGQVTGMRVFPVGLSQSGGDQGDDQNPATWTYDVIDLQNDAVIATAINPVTAPHQWRRPGVGWMIPATFGHAHYQLDPSGSPQLVLGWINEVADQEACAASE